MLSQLGQVIFYYFVLSNIAKFLAVLLFGIQKPLYRGEWKVRILVNSFTLLDITFVLLAIIFHVHLSSTTISDFLYTGMSCQLYWNMPAIVYLSFSIFLLSTIARFSIFYLHRDAYFYKFFALFYILEFSLILLILTKGMNSIFIGWELLGLSSVLLIAFYEHRSAVLKNSLIVLVIYKISDLLLYSILIYQLYLGVDQYTDITNTYAITLILIACLIKSSIFPWIWLPRAMEGPTPSSAVFYGGLSTHIPVLIFMQLWMNSKYHSHTIIISAVIGILISTICATFLSRQANDAKNAIAYSAITQLGIIYIEILLGWYNLALFHSVIHGIYRSFEFLKSPSLLYQVHNIEKNRRSIVDSMGFHVQRLLPIRIKNKIYQLAFHEFYLLRTLLRFIERFLGFNQSRMSIHAIKNYSYISFAIFILLISILLSVTNMNFSLVDFILFITAMVFNSIAMYFKYEPNKFLTLLSLSILSIYISLTRNFQHMLFLVACLFVLLLIIFIRFSIRQRDEFKTVENYSGMRFYSSFKNILILILGFSIIGIPGLGSFYFWSNIEHIVAKYDPSTVIICFYLITLNTITFFRFYYANYLGKKNYQKLYKTVEHI